MQIEHNQQNLTGQMLSTPIAPLPEGELPEKTYHTLYPGSTFIARDGTRHFFSGSGNFSTTDAGLQYELDKLSDRGGSPIYTKAPVILQSDLEPTQDIRNSAAEVIKKLQLSQQQKQG